ncbi:MAG: hypothetical protein ACXWWI_11530, partial [Nitrospira sp.]
LSLFRQRGNEMICPPTKSHLDDQLIKTLEDPGVRDQGNRPFTVGRPFSSPLKELDEILRQHVFSHRHDMSRHHLFGHDVGKICSLVNGP